METQREHSAEASRRTNPDEPWTHDPERWIECKWGTCDHPENPLRGRWHRMQIFGMHLWRVNPDLDLKTLDSIPGADWKYLHSVPGDGKETQEQLKAWASKTVKEERLHGRFVAAVARGETFDAFSFRA